MLTAIVEAQLHAGTINLEHVRRLHDAMSITITAIVDHGTDLLDVLIPAKDLRDRASSAKKNESVWAENLRQLVAAEGILSNKLARKRAFSQISVVLRSLYAGSTR
jgi:hypothetical protein